MSYFVLYFKHLPYIVLFFRLEGNLGATQGKLWQCRENFECQIVCVCDVYDDVWGIYSEKYIS